MQSQVFTLRILCSEASQVKQLVADVTHVRQSAKQSYIYFNFYFSISCHHHISLRYKDTNYLRDIDILQDHMKCKYY